MIYLLWALLNIALFISFIGICFRATKLIRDRIGVFASIIFVFGLLSFIGQSNNDNYNKEPNSNQIKTWKFLSEDSLNRRSTNSLFINLEKTSISKYELYISYSIDQQQMNTPISASSSTTGFIAGTNWKPASIVVNRTTDDDKFEYIVNGVVEWKLLGATIYTQGKNYHGIAFIK